MYGADWCGDCRRAKAYFADHVIDYEYIDVEARPEEIETVLRYNDGLKSIPVVVFADGTHLTEPSNADLEAKLAELAPVGDNSDRGSDSLVVRDNTKNARFELVDSADASLRSFANYSLRNGSVVIPHVETLVEHRGNGYAKRLMDGIMDDLRETGRFILPLCPFAAQYVRERPDTHNLLGTAS